MLGFKYINTKKTPLGVVQVGAVTRYEKTRNKTLITGSRIFKFGIITTVHMYINRLAGVDDAGVTMQGMEVKAGGKAKAPNEAWAWPHACEGNVVSGPVYGFSLVATAAV